MAAHEFGIMRCNPVHESRYDQFQPDQFHCISIEDYLFDQITAAWCEIDCFWHTIDQKSKGLAECGITLIPPTSLDTLLAGTENMDALAPLRRLLLQAKREEKYIIHFGI